MKENMKQKTYNTVASLVEAGNLISAGAASHAVNLGLVVATKPLVDAEVNALTVASDAFEDGKHVLRGYRTRLKQKQKEAYDLAFNVRDTLKRVLGRNYNPRWEGTGFGNSLRIPSKYAKLEQLLRTLKSFLTQNSQYEQANVATAALIEAAVTDLSEGKAAVTVQVGAVRTLLAARKQNERAIRSRIRLTVEELNKAIGPIDGRWDAFGLRQPGLKQAPAKPAKATVVSLINGVLRVGWDKVARAEYYRVWLRVMGQGEEARPAGTPSDEGFIFEALQSGAQVEVAISAVNNGGESGHSETLLVNIP